MTDLRTGNDANSEAPYSDEANGASDHDTWTKPMFQGGPEGFPSSLDSLLRAIEDQILPRLSASEAPNLKPSGETPSADALTQENRDAFLSELQDGSMESACRLVDEHLSRGISQEVIFLDLLAESARRLGALWEEDLCDFSDVTIGLFKLHEILRKYSEGDTMPARQPNLWAPHILLANADGDQHMFGLVMVAEFFRRDRWRVACEPGADARAVNDMVRTTHFDIVGLSAASTVQTKRLKQQITQLRKASCNPDLQVMVGGRVFQQDTDMVGKIGADLYAEDASAAPNMGRRLLAKVTS
jgi:methanogenic corrinoid protein MtbC1